MYYLTNFLVLYFRGKVTYRKSTCVIQFIQFFFSKCTLHVSYFECKISFGWMLYDNHKTNIRLNTGNLCQFSNYESITFLLRNGYRLLARKVGQLRDLVLHKKNKMRAGVSNGQTGRLSKSPRQLISY